MTVSISELSAGPSAAEQAVFGPYVPRLERPSPVGAWVAIGVLSAVTVGVVVLPFYFIYKAVKATRPVKGMGAFGLRRSRR